MKLNKFQVQRKVNECIFMSLQIEHGTASKKGGVLPGSTDWKPVPTLSKKNGVLVSKLDYTNRAFDLDDVLVPTNYVVTGVRFRKIGGHINFEVQVSFCLFSYSFSYCFMTFHKCHCLLGHTNQSSNS